MMDCSSLKYLSMCMQMSRLSHVDAFDHTVWLYEMFDLQFWSELRLCRCRALSLLAFSCVGLQLSVHVYNLHISMVNWSAHDGLQPCSSVKYLTMCK